MLADDGQFLVASDEAHCPHCSKLRRFSSIAGHSQRRTATGTLQLAGIHGTLAKSFLNAQELVVFTDAVGAAEAAGLDLADARGDDDVGNGAVLRLPAAVADDRLVAVALRQRDAIERLGERTNLVDLDQDRIGYALVDTTLKKFHIGDEVVVADQLE